VSSPPLCLTGASGFIGRRVLARLRQLGVADVTLLLRDPARVEGRDRHPDWRIVQGNLDGVLSPQLIPQGAVVLHLAAATGSAAADAMHRTNVDATRRLLDAARAANARHFIFVSSIAAGYLDQRWAPYARSKVAAEALFAQTPLPYTLVRPTMVFGSGSPNQQALERLATLAFPVMPGQGEVRVQPIHVDDLAQALAHLALEPPRVSGVIAIGGPTVLTMRELFAAMRQARGRAPVEPLRLPLGLIRRGLALAGALTRERLPVSAGQFVAFANDAVANPIAAGTLRLPAPRVSLEAMLAQPRTHA
jgi:nucleoside-diphosphate-sugar epimerase